MKPNNCTLSVGQLNIEGPEVWFVKVTIAGAEFIHIAQFPSEATAREFVKGVLERL